MTYPDKTALANAIIALIERDYGVFRQYYEWTQQITKTIVYQPDNDIRNVVDHLFLALTKADLSTLEGRAEAEINVTRARRHIFIGVRDCLAICAVQITDNINDYITELEYLGDRAYVNLRLTEAEISRRRRQLPVRKFDRTMGLEATLAEIGTIHDEIVELNAIVVDANNFLGQIARSYPIKGDVHSGAGRAYRRLQKRLVQITWALIVEIAGGIIVAYLIAKYLGRFIE